MIRKSFAMVLIFMAVSLSAMAQQDDELRLNCKDNWNSRGDGRNDWFKSCRMQEMTLPAAGGLFTVDGRGNGSVIVRGWDKNEIFLRAKLEGFGRNQADADSYAQQARVIVNGSLVRGEGAQVRGSGGWSVSFEVFVPRRSDLSLKGSNGSLHVSEVQGSIDLSTSNGSIHLRNVGGNVRGGTSNGSLHVDLDGTSWQGEGLDLRTVNGGVQLRLPENFNAHIETSTVNGGMNFDFPMTVVGKIGRELNTDIGSGGAPIRVKTTNGGVSIKRK
jgi:DUF4097 and DUF4098 domain-containing protein YvlB